ncbi:hypothetical protein M8C21_031013 [Ambrosia artemisiifolia]|uniref:F-box domain-containing protein n=1 Tax=Ambrosia artemisiifolia TaxID=4212 RepID=A0AAD5G3D5_AMBAR|nr:hypothetical protein M8C21_031013 [Ambrosia artemisiifolia]
MEKLAFDVVEEILVQLDVKDLIRCKSVCKSWQSFISSPRFVNAHLKRSCNNDLDNHELGHRRIGMGISTDEDDLWGYNYKGMTMDEDDWLSHDYLHVVGSCNGLVCVCPHDVVFVVTNPSIREQRKLPTPPYPRDMDEHVIRSESCWGFGYDSSTDDYKVIAGFAKSKTWDSKLRMFFYVLTLKSNTWIFIGKVKYKYADGVSGILCGGALHWFFIDDNKKVIMSLNLSTEEFKEIPQPVDEEYDCNPFDDYKLDMDCTKAAREGRDCRGQHKKKEEEYEEEEFL